MVGDWNNLPSRSLDAAPHAVPLTKAKKKGKEWKEGLVKQIHEAIEQYPSIYLFRVFNMRTEQFQDLRGDLRETSRFIMGNNKLLQVALGRSESDETRENLHLLSEKVQGSVGLLFTSLSKEEVVKVVEDFSHEDFARSGTKALHNFSLQEGPLSSHLGPLPHTLEVQLRKWGMPTRLNKGVVELTTDFQVCREGQVLDTNQAAILRVFGVKMATFRLKLVAAWHQEGEEFEEFEGGDGDDESVGEGDELMDDE